MLRSEVKLVFMFLLFHFISAGLQDLTWIGIDATPGARRLLTQIQNSLRFIGSAGPSPLSLVQRTWELISVPKAGALLDCFLLENYVHSSVCLGIFAFLIGEVKRRTNRMWRVSRNENLRIV